MHNSKVSGMSIKSYAEQRGKTVQAVYQQMKRHENATALIGHVHVCRQGNKDVKYLDEEAVRILDEGSASTPTIIIQDTLKDELALVSAERQTWKDQANKLQGKVELLTEMLDKKELELRRLEAPQHQIDDLNAKIASLGVENAKLVLEVEKERKTSQEAKNELTDIKNTWWYKLFVKLFGPKSL